MKHFRIWLARLILPRDMQIIREGSVVLSPGFTGTISHHGPAGGGGKGGNATVHGSDIAIGGRGSPNGTATFGGHKGRWHDLGGGLMGWWIDEEDSKYPDDGYSPDKDEFDQLDEGRAWDGLLFLAAMLAVTVLIIAGISAWRYVADCTAHPQLGVWECAAAWGYRLLPG